MRLVGLMFVVSEKTFEWGTFVFSEKFQGMILRL